jgi:hypothetical protein
MSEAGEEAMLTVTVVTKALENHKVLQEETMEAVDVRVVHDGFTYEDGSSPTEGPGIHITLPNGACPFWEAEFAKQRGRKLDVFVMNEDGKTVNRFVL